MFQLDLTRKYICILRFYLRFKSLYTESDDGSEGRKPCSFHNNKKMY